MSKILVVYHSQSGTTLALMQALCEGAMTEAHTDVRLVPALEATTEDLLWCDAVVFGTPENLGYLSGGMKDFFDRTFYPSQSHQLNLPYVVVISAGNDGTGALRQLERIVKGYPMRCVSEPLILKGELCDEGITACKELGQAVAAGMSLGIF